MTESQGELKNYGFDIYGCRHFVELFCIEEHKHFIMQYHTDCSVPLHLIGETTPKPFPLSLRLKSLFQNANNPFKILLGFLPKIYL
jgi:hypothetical protein